MKTMKIPLSQGLEAAVDFADWCWLSRWKWCAKVSNGTVYAVRRRGRGKSGSHMMRMHREILSAGDGVIVDHKDGDGLNNCRSNLRLCSHAENCRNRRKYRDTKRFKGVRRANQLKGWVAYIAKDGKLHHLGTYDTEVEAAVAYNDAAKQLHGEFASLNPIP